MTFEAGGFEKKMGECPRHGEPVLSLACRHMEKGPPEEIWLGSNRIAIGLACSTLPMPSIEEEFLVACVACIKPKIKRLSDRLPEGEDIRDRVKGLDVYEKELMIAD